jgi:hypothetical protein
MQISLNVAEFFVDTLLHQPLVVPGTTKARRTREQLAELTASRGS